MPESKKPDDEVTVESILFTKMNEEAVEASSGASDNPKNIDEPTVPLYLGTTTDVETGECRPLGV